MDTTQTKILNREKITCNLKWENITSQTKRSTDPFDMTFSYSIGSYRCNALLNVSGVVEL